jgi:hypothetical protein
MKSINSQLGELNFHDSKIRGIQLVFPRGNDRTCAIDIDYYDWEGNEERRKTEPDAQWIWKHLRLEFGHLAHSEFSAPDLKSRVQDIDDIALLIDSDTELISLKFFLQNWTDDKQGFILIIGSQLKLHWIEGYQKTGQSHWPIKGD